MSRLPEIQLDDRRFQDLVSEARLRITRSCPEWTEHNVSDPGITLIELFAWMTEMTIYRLNRVPDKLHVTLLELLGHPARRPELGRHRRALPARRAADRAAGDPRRRDRGEHPAHRARRRGHLPGARGLHDPGRQAVRLRPAAGRPGQGHRRRRRRGAPPGRRPRRVRQPAGGRRRAVPRLRRADRPARAPGRRRRLAGARRGRQPRGPAAALGGLPGRQPVGGGDRPRGPHRRLQLRRRRGRAAAPGALRGPAAGRPPHALGALPHRRQDPPRRRRARPTRRRRRSTRSPPRRSARCLPASHAAQEENEILGVSDGTPGQTFALRYSPVLKPSHGRDARGPGPGVRRLGGAGSCGPTSSVSTTFDRHYILNPVQGEIELGPAIRETDGGWTQYGSVPPKGAVLRFTKLPPRRRAQRQRRRRRADRDALRARRASTR